ncbi:hypothetical protein AB4Z39_10265 [Mycobacterium adipatum]|uniref:hypothetical protein n=1 Tax=Mycobacterium adipatum TaxID=1682113 RepID=UPI002BE36C0C|nr:hypothetical protein [Rhodoglobus sp.]
MLKVIGGWGNREDSLQACAQRLQQSFEYIPADPQVYGPWGVWRQDASDNDRYELAPIDTTDRDVVTAAISAVTERVNNGPKATPGLNIELARRLLDNTSGASPIWLEYTARAGFIGMKRPFNHLVLTLEDGIDESVVTRAMSALVVAWEPDRLGVASQDVQRAQGHKPPEAVVGWLTYIKDGTQFDRDALDAEIVVHEADGGVYITVPGTPDDPSMEHIRRVRIALGYPNAD